MIIRYHPYRLVVTVFPRLGQRGVKPLSHAYGKRGQGWGGVLWARKGQNAQACLRYNVTMICRRVFPSERGKVGQVCGERVPGAA
jgi:hypothetical protein